MLGPSSCSHNNSTWRAPSFPGIGCAVLAPHPELHGFSADPAIWVRTVNSVALQHSWKVTLQKSFEKKRLRTAANILHGQTGASALMSTFEALPGSYDIHFMEMRSRQDLLEACNCNLAWASSPAARQYIIDEIRDPTHAAILSVQPMEPSLHAFVRKAAEQQDAASRRLATPSLERSTPQALLRRGCFSCDGTGHAIGTVRKLCDRPCNAKRARSQHSVSALTALVDTAHGPAATSRRTRTPAVDRATYSSLRAAHRCSRPATPHGVSSWPRFPSSKTCSPT